MRFQKYLIATLTVAVIILGARGCAQDRRIDYLEMTHDASLTARVSHLEYVADKFASLYWEGDAKLSSVERDMLLLHRDFLLAKIDMRMADTELLLRIERGKPK